MLGGPFILSGQTGFSLSHIEGITLGTSEEVDEVAGGSSGIDVDRIVRLTTGPVKYKYNLKRLLTLRRGWNVLRT